MPQLSPTGLLPVSAEYALRAMSCLSEAWRLGEARRARDIAEITAVPPHYLSKVLRRLVEAGLLTSAKGHHGGFRLARAPDSIRFSEVLSAMETNSGDGHCVFGWGHCNSEQPCPLHHSWSELSQVFGGWADRMTLALVQTEGMCPMPEGRRAGAEDDSRP